MSPVQPCRLKLLANLFGSEHLVMKCNQPNDGDKSKALLTLGAPTPLCFCHRRQFGQWAALKVAKQAMAGDGPQPEAAEGAASEGEE